MSIFTKWFELFKYQPVEDEAQTFNVDVALNGNWDKVDTALHGLDTGKEALVKNAVAKANPADADSVVLVDSADAGKTKRLTWTNIKAALSKVFAALKHTHPISDILDLAEEIAAIKAAMSNKAAIYEYSGDAAGRPDFDFDSLRAAGMHKLAGRFDAAQHRPDRAYGDYSIIVTSNNDCMAQIAVYYDTGTQEMSLAWRRCAWNGAWDVVWRYAATTTPPQEYDLPLAAGVTRARKSYYIKKQNGRVQVHFCVSYQPAGFRTVVLGILPAGYRPAETETDSCVATEATGDVLGPATVEVLYDGTVRVYANVTGAIGATGSIEFTATH